MVIFSRGALFVEPVVPCSELPLGSGAEGAVDPRILLRGNRQTSPRVDMGGDALAHLVAPTH